jgi:N-acetylmuramoyl-L-alanine amidase/FG-GAP-like repeat
MAHNRSRFVLLCQQSLAVAVVAAITAPAANLVSLDIVAPPRGGQAGAGIAQPPSGSAGASEVATRPVEPTVSKVPLTGVSKAGLRALRGRQAPSPGTGSGSVQLASADTTAPSRSTPEEGLAALSAPTPTNGLATVGVTWAHAAAVPEGSLAISLRTRRGSTWSTWKKVPYHPDEGPDPTSTEGRNATPGTDPIYVGKVDDVQVRAVTDSGVAPRGMKISLVDPGKDRTALESPGIDTGGISLSADDTDDATGTTTADGDTTGDVEMASSVTPKPRIYSRKQWGADERMRDKPSLHYGEVHGGFVHHTVNANSYSRSQVPSIIRGIYAYHTQSRGWSDVGYNFLVDRFGRIWEGRAGGVGRPVVGAHTLGYNDDAFAMSAIGNYDIKRPSSAMVHAFGRLFAWKLGLHGVRAGDKRVWITKRHFRAISGHRDAGQTACPGRYLYAKIPTIRRLASGQQRSFAARNRRVNLAGGPKADIVVRSKKSHRAYLIRTGANGKVARVTPTGTYFRYANRIIGAGDWDRDGRADVITRSKRTGRLFLYRGNGHGRFGDPIQMSRKRFGNVRLLVGVGDMTGDGHPDLLGQPARHAMRIYPGKGRSGLRHSYVAHSHIAGAQQMGVNLFNADGAPDTVVRRRNGALIFYPGNGPGGLTTGHRIGSLRGYDWLIGVGDVTGDRRADLVGRSASTGRLWLLPGRNKSFGHRRHFGGNMKRFDLAG